MAAVGGTRVRHYKELAYMGFIPVLLHLPTIFRNMAFCKRDIKEWEPDVVILVDYPGFNLNIAKYVSTHTDIPVYYYIAPKIWAWKEWRIRSIKRYVSELFSILPFEIDFFERKHHFPIHYVGNPTADEVRQFRADYAEKRDDFIDRQGLKTDQPIIALLAGSRRQEIKDNLPAMIEAVEQFAGYQLVLAGAPSIEDEYYEQFIAHTSVQLVRNDTYALLSHATAALVTSGTATLETALFHVPQVVCYETPIKHIVRFAFRHIIHVKFISLVNLIAGREVVRELLADEFSVENIRTELEKILPEGTKREQQLADYNELQAILGEEEAPENAARLMCNMLRAE